MGCKALSAIIQESRLESTQFRIMTILADSASDFTYDGEVHTNILRDIVNINLEDLLTALKHLQEQGEFDLLDIYPDDEPDSFQVSYRLNILTQDEWERSHLSYDLKQARADLQALEPTGYVYLMHCGPYYKIGRSIDPDKRLEQLAIQLPYKPQLVHSIASNTPAWTEQFFHTYFATKRMNGEWFKLDEADVEYFCTFERLDMRRCKDTILALPA